MKILIKIPDTSGLMTAPVLNTRTSGLVKKTTDYDTKIAEIEKNITNHEHAKNTTQEFNKLTEKNFQEKLKQTNLVCKTDFDSKLISFNREITFINQHLMY